MPGNDLRNMVLAAAGRPEVPAAVQQLYADLEAAIDRRRPVCVASGRCCRFDDYGHRLYVTTMELAAFVAQLDRPAHHGDGAGCPFQAGRLCDVHSIRPMGCRVFYCDAAAGWTSAIYEEFHRRLKSLHESMDVPYRYMEWRQALGAVLGTANLARIAKSL